MISIQHMYRHNKDVVVACPPMKNNDNVSMIARSAACLGAKHLVLTGTNRINEHISRECYIEISNHRTLLPVLQKFKHDGYFLVGLEQCDKAKSITDYKFPERDIVFVVGNETRGMDIETQNIMDVMIEIPLFNRPYSLNVAVATSICLAEYARQFGT